MYCNFVSMIYDGWVLISACAVCIRYNCTRGNNKDTVTDRQTGIIVHTNVQIDTQTEIYAEKERDTKRDQGSQTERKTDMQMAQLVKMFMPQWGIEPRLLLSG